LKRYAVNIITILSVICTLRHFTTSDPQVQGKDEVELKDGEGIDASEVEDEDDEDVVDDTGLTGSTVEEIIAQAQELARNKTKTKRQNSNVVL
jgi:hypothetical protein